MKSLDNCISFSTEIMGKHKEKYKGAGSVFASYLASMPNSNNPVVDFETIPLPDNMKACTLLEQIGAERSWLEDQINSDLAILEKNRIYTVKDLRILSKESWKQIELLPIVKDLLKEAIQRGQSPLDDRILKKLEKKALKKREKPEKKARKEREKLERNEPKDEDIYEFKTEKNILPTVASESSTSDSSSDEVTQVNKANLVSPISLGSTPTVSQRPTKQVMGNKLRIRAVNGQAYEVDRWCPHKNQDLASRGVVVGSTLICTKHDWEFSLDQGGKCTRHGATINACPINDW